MVTVVARVVVGFGVQACGEVAVGAVWSVLVAGAVPAIDEGLGFEQGVELPTTSQDTTPRRSKRMLAVVGSCERSRVRPLAR